MSSCGPCAAARQYVLNAAVWLDLSLNGALGGSPKETLSHRTARARATGSRAAAIFCAVLTSVWRAFGADVDHCTWALDPGPGIDAEVWHWSPPDAPEAALPTPAATIARPTGA